MILNQTTPQKNMCAWQAKPLGRTGDLAGWKIRMRKLCPNPQIGMIVWLDKNYYSKDEQQYITESIGYKVLKIKHDGDAVWERGQIIRH